jgi:hypothetical protein
LLFVPGATAAQDDCLPPSPAESAAPLARTDHDVSGNRIAAGCGPLVGAVSRIDLSGVPTWVLPDPTDRGRSWLVVLEDGRVELIVSEAGSGPTISQTETPPLPAGHPPLAAALAADQLVVGSALAASGWFEMPLPDTRVTEVEGRALAALTGPTDRYRHGVLGDELEASAIDVRDADGLVVRVEVDDAEVIEGTSVMVADIAPDQPGPELLVTVSDPESGARLRLYGLDGRIVAESEPIGRGFRWLHQLAAAPLGPGGETEIIVVRTPHIGGLVEAYRLSGDRLQRVAALEGYSSHVLGSPNLDMAVLADGDGDGRLEVIVPTQDHRALALLARTAGGFEELDRLALEGVLATNVSATPSATGGLVLAAGTADGRLHIFR